MTRQERLIKMHEACGWFNVKPNPLGNGTFCGTYSPADDVFYGTGDPSKSLDALAAAERATLGDGKSKESKRKWYRYELSMTRIAAAQIGVSAGGGLGVTIILRMSCEDRFTALGASLGLWGEEGE